MSWTKSTVKEDLQNGFLKDVAREAVPRGKNRLCEWSRAMIGSHIDLSGNIGSTSGQKVVSAHFWNKMKVCPYDSTWWHPCFTGEAYRTVVPPFITKSR